MVENLERWNTAISGLTLIVLTLTLVVLVWYTIETHKIAIQTEESNLRPVILRDGFINWSNINFTENQSTNRIDGTPIRFTILKNIATSIKGHIVIDGYSYQLLWGNAITQQDEGTFSYFPIWGWMKPGTILFAIFNPNSRRESSAQNQIAIEYQDIEGNYYYTIEDASSSNQKSFKGKMRTL